MAKDKNKFQLNKSSDRNFDIKKKVARKFDLSKDDEEVDVSAVVTDQGNAESTNNQQQNTDATVQLLEASENGAKNRSWMWIAVVIALILGIAIWWFMTNPATEATAPSSEQVAKSETPTEKSSNTPTVNPADINVSDDARAQQADKPQNGYAIASGDNGQADLSAQNAKPDTPSIQTGQVVSQKANSVQTDNVPTSESQKASVQTQTSSSAAADIETEALNVIRGVYGDGEQRRQALGNRYAEIQARVNQMKRDGLF